MEDFVKHQTVFDTDQQQLGVIYAKALLGFGQQNGNVDALVEELSSVVSVISEVPGFQKSLDSPRVGLEDKANLLDKAFGGKVDKGLLNFLKVLGRKGRFDCLPAIADAAISMQDEMSGRVQATLTSATDMDESIKNGIAEKLSKALGKTVSLRSIVDPEIIGGVVVRVGDTVYDASVVNQLEQVRARAVKKAADSIREKLDKFVTTS